MWMEKQLKKNVYLIAGRSGSGKDSIVDGVVTKGFSRIVSYTTRPRRKNEKNTHIFITDSEVDSYKDDMCAYTKIGDYEYFATYEQLKNNDIYIIDPAGIENLLSKKANHVHESLENINFIVIYVYVPQELRIGRILNIRKDEIEVMAKRLKDEDKQFAEFEEKQLYDYIITNINLEESITSVINIINSNNELVR